jgi:serine/threonine protein phosphatase PrpC
MVINIYSRTEIGSVREHNEDNFIVGSDPASNEWSFLSENQTVGSKGVFIAVADGMGGAEAGEVASQIAVDTAKSVYIEKTNPFPVDNFEIIDILKEIISKAHERIIDDIRENPGREGMGTTILAGIIYKNNLFIGWCGDSRAYRFNKDGIARLKHYDLEKLEILTQDHSMVWEYVESGKMTAEEARLNIHSNIITQSLGAKAGEIHPGISIFSLNEGDRLLFCSDGLNSMIADERISEILSMEKSTFETCDLLINEAILEGGHDNITLCIVDVLKTDEIAVSAANDTVVTKMIPKVEDIDDENKIGFGKKLLKLLLIAFPILLAVFFATYYMSDGFNKWVKTKKQIITSSTDKQDTSPTQINSGSKGKSTFDSIKKPEISKPPMATDLTTIAPKPDVKKKNENKTKKKSGSKDQLQIKIEEMENKVKDFQQGMINMKGELNKLQNKKNSSDLIDQINKTLDELNSYYVYDYKKGKMGFNISLGSGKLEPRFNRTKNEFENIKAEFNKLRNQAKSQDIGKKTIDSVRQE